MTHGMGQLGMNVAGSRMRPRLSGRGTMVGIVMDILGVPIVAHNIVAAAIGVKCPIHPQLISALAPGPPFGCPKYACPAHRLPPRVAWLIWPRRPS